MKLSLGTLDWLLKYQRKRKLNIISVYVSQFDLHRIEMYKIN